MQLELRPRVLAGIAIGLIITTVAIVKLSNVFATLDAERRDAISARDRSIARRDRDIAARDKFIAAKLREDSLKLRVIERNATTRLAASSATLAEANRRLDSLMAANGAEAPVPAVEVRAIRLSYEGTLADCRALNDAKDSRIGTLVFAVDSMQKNRSQMDTTRAEVDSTRRDLEAALDPPWYRRTLGWIGSRLPALGIGAAIGFAVARSESVAPVSGGGAGVLRSRAPRAGNSLFRPRATAPGGVRRGAIGY
jgi:hypothetical protein